MYLSRRHFVLFYLVIVINRSIGSTINIGLLPKAANAVADYFSANCVHFLSGHTSNGTFLNHMVAKIRSLESSRYFLFSNISSYYNFLKRNEKGQCTVPLRVIVHSKETEMARDYRDFHAIYEDYSAYANAGLWLIFLNSFDDVFITKVFRNFFLPLDLEILVAWTHEEKVYLKEIFQISVSSPIRQSYFGVWSSQEGFTSSQPPSRYFRRSNLEGFKFKVGYVENNGPFTMTRSTATGDFLDGYVGNVWHALEDLLNISSSYVTVKLKRNRNENENSWLRIMKMLKEKKIDVGVGDFVPSPDRLDYFDFSYPLLTSNFQLYYQAVPEFPFQVYLFPFQKYVWMFLFNWWILSSIFIFAAGRLSKKTETLTGMSTFLFIVFGGLCAQSSPLVPRSSSCRMLFLFTYVMATVIIPSYSAYLIHFLASEPKGVSFDNIFDFYNSGTHEIILVDGSFEYFFFNSRTELNYLKKMFEELQIKELPKSYDEAIRMVCSKGNIAFFTITSTFLWKWRQNEPSDLTSKCVLRKMTKDAGILLNSLIFPKNSRFKGIIDHHLKILQQIGMIKSIEEEFWVKQPTSIEKTWKTVGLKESSGIFKIAAFGMILSSGIFILERSLKKLFRSTKNSRKKKRASLHF